MASKALLERALEAEKHDPADHDRRNTRNGKSPKTLKGEFGELDLETPRDRKATFDPKIVAKADEVNRVRRQDHLHVRVV
jgi:putative transposase